MSGVLDIAQLVRGQHGTSGGLEEDLRAVTGRQVSCDWSQSPGLSLVQRITLL